MEPWTAIEALAQWAASEQQIQIFAALGVSMLRSLFRRDDLRETVLAGVAAVLVALLASWWVIGEDRPWGAKGRVVVALSGFVARDVVELAEWSVLLARKDPGKILNVVLSRLGLKLSKKAERADD